LDNQLVILIALYKEEEVRLGAFIKQCLEDVEGPGYLLANYHQRALFQVQETLRVRHNYEDEFFEEKDRLSRSISRFETLFENNKSQFLKERLQELRAKLDQLNSTPKTNSSGQEENILENALADLVYRRIKKFKLILDRSKNFYLEFSGSKKAIKIVVPNVKLHIKEDTFYDSQLRILQKIGFELTNGNRLEILFIIEGETTIERIKFLLVKLFFKVFYYKSFQNESYIEFQN